MLLKVVECDELSRANAGGKGVLMCLKAGENDYVDELGCCGNGGGERKKKARRRR